MSHPLDGAFLRIERAEKHFWDLCEEFNKFRESNVDKVIIEQNQNPPRDVKIWLDKSIAVPIILSLLVSDCIHNLRSALDYVVYELAILDAGFPQKNTQFPIEDDPQVFHKRRRNKQLCGLSDYHVAMIEAMQPYKGANWARLLRDISNPDKHRHLVTMRTRIENPINVSPVGFLGDFEVAFSGNKLYVKREYAFTIAFSDGKLSVIKTLDELKSQVTQAINAFKPEFK